MFCRKCGEKIDGDSKFCTSCGEKTIDHEPNVSETQNIGKWSWGAAAITFWYALSMKFKNLWMYLVILIGIRALDNSQNISLSVIGLLLYITIFVYMGLNGRKLAWENRKWKSLDQFLKTQRVWDVCGIIVFILTVLVGFAGVE